MFWLGCLLCDTGSPPEIEAAIDEGWLGMRRADAGDPRFTHFGYCPDCQQTRPADCERRLIFVGVP